MRVTSVFLKEECFSTGSSRIPVDSLVVAANGDDADLTRQ